MIVNKFLAVIIIWSSIVTSGPFFSGIFHKNVVTMDYITGRLAEVKENQIEEYGTSDQVIATNMSLAIVENKAELSLVIDSRKYEFSVLLMPSYMGIYEGNTIVGVDSDSEELISFRIEREAYKIGLMQDREMLEGKTVFYLGIFEAEKNIVYYFQVELNGLDIETILQSAQEGFVDSGYTSEMMERIEVAYLTLSVGDFVMKDDSTNLVAEIDFTQQDMSVLMNDTTDMLSSAISQVKDLSKEGFVKMNGKSSRALIKGIPDSVYKSGEFEKWKKVWNGWSEKTGYAVYPMSYGLSNNGRLHYVMTYSISVDCDWDDQIFDIGYRITNNCWVLYMTNTDELTIFDSRARVAVDANVYFKSKSDEGVFTRRYYSLVKADSWIQIATKYVVGHIPYVGMIVDAYDILSGIGDVTEGKWYPFADNYELQVQEGKLIKEVYVYAEKLKQVGDCLYLVLKGDRIKSVSYGFGYSVYDPAWW